jgi:uncharacterized repeat protein (TIGR01451 family)
MVCILTAALLASTTPPHAFALSAGDVTFTLVTPFLAQDSNNSCAAGPKASYIEVLVANPAGGTGTLNNLTANLSAFAGAAGVSLDAGESATRYIGVLADGASFPLYFYVNYPCQAGSNPPAITSTFTATVSDGVTPSLTSGTLTLTTRSEISANAGGQVISSTIGPGAVIGQIIPMTVQYDFGNPGGAQVAMIQPAGNVNFDSGCFRLMSTDITAVTGFTAGLTTSADDRLYFTGVNGASSNTATVVYYFKMLCSGVSTTANPFSDLTSGGQLKYTGNFGTCSAVGAACPVYTAPTNPFTISKSVSPANLPTGGTATYTVIITNPSIYASKIEKIVDLLPAGLTFAAIGGASQVTAANSSSVPANTTFNAAGSTATWSCANGAAAGTPCTYTVGNLAAGAIGSVNFAVAVNSSVPAGTTQINNAANVTSAQGAGAPASDFTPLVIPPPLANNDSTTTTGTTPAALTPAINDTARGGTSLVPGTIDLDPATVGQQTTLTVPGQGSWVLNTTTGQVTFTAIVGFVGTTSTPYTIQDSIGQTSNQANLSVAVSAPSAPIAANDSTSTVGTTPAILTPVTNDTAGGNGAALVAGTIDLDPTTAGQQISLTTVQGTWALNTTTGDVTFTPAAGFIGTASAPYTIQDNYSQISNQANLAVTVSSPATPTANNDSTTTIGTTPVSLSPAINDTAGTGATLVAGTIDLDPATAGQ